MLTTEEIEYSVGEVLRRNQSASLRFDHPGLAKVTLDIEELSGASLIQSTFATGKESLIIPLLRHEPTVVMYFQLQGGVNFCLKNSVDVPERHHALCYLPLLDSNFVVDQHTIVQDLAIRFKPDVVAAQLLEVGMEDEDWQRLLEEGDQPFSTIRESQQMGSQMIETLRQLENCPYKGKFGLAYKDSLIRLLLIEQLMIFRQNRQKLEAPDTKLTRQDIEALHELKRYLEQNYLDDLSLDKIAKVSGLNNFKLKYGFKKLFDTSVMRYIDDQKMSHARQLLLDGRQEVLEVADLLGYNHYTNFSAAFKRRFGCSPVRLKEQAFSLN